MQTGGSIAEDVEPAGQRREAAPCPRTILFVSEDDSFRSTTHACLEEENFLVRSCANAARVPALFFSPAKSRPGSRRGVDLLLIDVDGLGAPGLRLAGALTSFEPGLPVIIISGPDTKEGAPAEFQRRIWKFVKKPIATPELLELIHNTLTPALGGAGRHHEPRPSLPVGAAGLRGAEP